MKQLLLIFFLTSLVMQAEETWIEVLKNHYSHKIDIIRFSNTEASRKRAQKLHSINLRALAAKKESRSEYHDIFEILAKRLPTQIISKPEDINGEFNFSMSVAKNLPKYLSNELLTMLGTPEGWTPDEIQKFPISGKPFQFDFTKRHIFVDSISKEDPKTIFEVPSLSFQ